MRVDADHPYPPPIEAVAVNGPTAEERVDLDDPAAVDRAIALHQAGQAVFTVPFGSAGDGTLTWLDPRPHAAHAADAERHRRR